MTTTDPLDLWVMEDFAAHPGLLQAALDGAYRAMGLSAPKLNIRVLSWSRAWSDLARAPDQGARPHVIQVGTSWLNPLVHLGLLRPFPAEAEPGTAWPVASLAAPLNEDRWIDGYAWGLPWMVDVRLLYARADHPPCAKIEDFAACLGPECQWLVPAQSEPGLVQMLAMWIWSWGGELIPQEGTFAKSWDGAVRALHAMGRAGGIDGSGLTMGSAEAHDRFFLQGRGDMVVTRPWAQGHQRAVAVLPFPSSGFGRNVFLGGSYLSVTTREPVHPEGFRVAGLLTSPTAQRMLSRATGYWPATEGVALPVLDPAVPVGVAENVADAVRTLPSVPHWRYLERLLARAGSDLLRTTVRREPWGRAQEILERIEQDVDEVRAVTAL